MALGFRFLTRKNGKPQTLAGRQPGGGALPLPPNCYTPLCRPCQALRACAQHHRGGMLRALLNTTPGEGAAAAALVPGGPPAAAPAPPAAAPFLPHAQLCQAAEVALNDACGRLSAGGEAACAALLDYIGQITVGCACVASGL
jgi:hypothetical protein